jgi:hypothetical protein
MRRHGLHDLVKRQILVVIGLDNNMPHTGQQFSYRRLVRQIDPERHCVHETAKNLFELRSMTIADRCPQHHIGLSGIAGEQRGKGRG